MRLKLVLSSRQTLHQVKKPGPLYKLCNSCRCCCNLQDGQVGLWINVVSIFQKGYKLQPRVKEIIMRQNVMKPWNKFYKKKATQERERKGNKGQGPKSPIQRKQNSPTKAGLSVASQIPVHTHTHTHKYSKYRDHDLWHIWDLEMGPQQQLQLSQVNFCILSVCLSFKLKLEWLLGCWWSNVQLLGSPKGG
jgi:hypothetical protein